MFVGESQVPSKYKTKGFAPTNIGDTIFVGDNNNIGTVINKVINNMDLNDAIISKEYILGNGLINLPFEVNTGKLEVIVIPTGNNKVIFQKITVFVTGKVYTRKYENSWSDWISGSDNIDGGSF